MTEDQKRNIEQTPDANPMNGNQSFSSRWLAYTKYLLFESGLIDFAKLTALTIIAGFFIVGSYLQSITGIFTYNIDVKRYIAAGVNIPIGILVLLRQELLRSALNVFIVLGIAIAVLSIIAVILIKFKFIPKTLIWTYDKISGFAKQINYPFAGVAKLSLATFILTFIAVFSYFYGTVIYPQMPQMLGGGKPTDVVLIFNEGQLENFDGIIPKVTSNRSDTVELIMELTDGYLIRDKATGVTLIIKNELIQAIVDPSKLPTLTPSQTASPTIAPAVTPTANTTSIPVLSATP